MSVKEQRNARSGRLPAIKHWPSDKARRWTEELVESAAANASIVAIVAIGSAVRDTRTASDLDLVLVHDQHAPRLKPPIEIDVRSYPKDDVPDLVDGGHDVLGWAILFGKCIFERNQYWRELKGRYEGRVPLPSASTSLKRAQRAQKVVRELLAIGDEEAALEQHLSLVTHLARARLIQSGIYPKSRPELPEQLKAAGNPELAGHFQDALAQRKPVRQLWEDLCFILRIEQERQGTRSEASKASP